MQATSFSEETKCIEYKHWVLLLHWLWSFVVNYYEFDNVMVLERLLVLYLKEITLFEIALDIAQHA